MQKEKSIKMRSTHLKGEMRAVTSQKRSGERGHRKMASKRRATVGRDFNRGLEYEGAVGQGDNKLSCSCCWTQTGSPDDTSVSLTYPDSVISLLKTTQWRNTAHVTVGLHDVSGIY